MPEINIMERLEEDGVVIIENFLTEEEVEELKNAGIQHTKNAEKESQRPVFSTTQLPQSKNDYFIESSDKVRYFYEVGALDEKGDLQVPPERALVRTGHALHWLDDTFKKASFSEKVKDTCRTLGFVDPVIVQSLYIYKNPEIGSEVVIHQDATYLYTEPPDCLVGFWYALDDATTENGCLWFAPGSQKNGVFKRYIRNPDPTSEDRVIYVGSPPDYTKFSFVPAPVKKGTCVLIHGKVLHYSENNTSEHSRHAYTFHVVDAGRSKYSPQNWLQVDPNDGFKSIYKN